ncbi:MAG TPA: ATP-binding cassette domain-containing protein [Bryobacteraceae bacterium]|nr:ATP-binding cassette domain-containing protein [Bryobacteraceae bacterium]
MSLPALIDLIEVSIYRGAKLALDRLTLRIGLGEHVAILGPNGCGKSTLIKTITRECYPVIRPGSSIRILGRETWNIFELRSLLGIVSNDLMNTFTRELTGREVVLSAFFSSVGIFAHQHVTGEMRGKTARALERLEIAHLADRPTSEMSSGEARRVLLARALVHEPHALLFDEPSTSLDLFAQNELHQAMRKLARAGTAIVLVTHHLADIIPEIERVILMSHGRVAADGRKPEILTAARLGALFSMPVDLAERDGHYHLW